MRHPDEHLSGYSPALGFCLECRSVIRMVGTRWYGTDNSGPFCKVACMRAAGKAGSLPDYVEEHPPEVQPLLPFDHFDLNSVSIVDNPPPGCEAKS